MTSFPPDSNDQALLQLASALRDINYRFTTTTPATHERVNQRPENKWARDLQGVFGWSRSLQSEVLPPHIWHLMRAANVAVHDDEGWRSLVRFSSLDNQLFVHSSFPTTQPDAVFFGPDTYRFATAIKNYFAAKSRPVNRAVDIGCGGGAGAILMALACPHATVLAVDINDLALRFTRINAVLADASRVQAQHSNLLKDVEGSFDFIVANPPYLVDASERAYRHGGGPLGAGLSLAIVESALERLARGGTLLLYTGVAIIESSDPFRAAVAEKLDGADVAWTYNEVDPDVFGEELESGAYTQTDRIAAVVLTMTKTA